MKEIRASIKPHKLGAVTLALPGATDKTGTITEGQPRVTRVMPLNATPEKEILRIAAAIDVHSEHPLAQAVVKYARDKSIEFPRSENYQARSRRGAQAELEGHHYFVGNHRFTHELAVCSEEVERALAEIEAQAQSVVVVGHKPHADCQGEVLGVLAVGDAIRPNAIEAVRSLHSTGVRQVIMLSGDSQRTVDAIARQVGIDEAQGDLLPDQKIERVRELMKRHKHVGMIGDGVNDAPANAPVIGIAQTEFTNGRGGKAMLTEPAGEGRRKLGRRWLAFEKDRAYRPRPLSASLTNCRRKNSRRCGVSCIPTNCRSR